METQTIKTKANEGTSKEALKKAGTIVGSAAVGAGAVVAGDMTRDDEELNIPDPIVIHVDDTTSEETTEEVATEATHHVAEAHTAPTTEPQPQGNATEQHATEGNTGTTPGNSHPEQDVINTEDIPNVDPNLIAHNLTDDVIMVDPADIDAGNLDIAAVGNIETVDGQTLTAAQFTGDNGETLYMVDVDGDHTYDIVTDASGNVLANIPSTVTVSDTENIIGVNNGDTGYLAQNEHDINDAQNTDANDVTEDIVDLG